MSFEPTEMQKKAIENDGNILVAAAAGSGKTAVLVERVITKLTRKENPVSIDRMLIVTFTKAAAAEMRSRIEKRIYEECAKRQDEAALLKQRHLINSADICTIDSFCINLVRENFEKCGVEPDFKVSDGSDMQVIRNKVMNGIIEKYLSRNDSAMNLLLEITDCEYSTDNLSSIIEEIYLYSQQLPFPENFLNSLIYPYTQPFDKNNNWYASVFSYAKQITESLIKKVENLAECAPLIESKPQNYMDYAQTVSLVISHIQEAVFSDDWDKVFDVIHSADFAKAPSCSKSDPAAVSFKQIKDDIFSNFDELISFFKKNAEDTQAEYKKLYPAAKLLTDMINEYSVSLFDAFKKENSLTFYNTEQLALSLLCEYSSDGEIIIKDTAKELMNKYDEVLVDEFQDVNDLQNMLFYVLSNREKKLFVVGDVKQSIYGFRGSNPKNFMTKKDSYIPVIRAKANDPQKIILSDNFRSRKEVCDFINYFFSLFMTEKAGGLVYNSEERLNPAKDFPKTDAPKTELIIADNENCTLSKDRLEFEAECIAEHIKNIINEPAFIKCDDSVRKAQYSDIVILLNTMKGKADIISKVLSSFSIPVSCAKESFKETVEISVITALLKTIDNPRNDISLLQTLMSPIFGFDAEEIAKIRISHKTDDLYQALLFAAQNGNLSAEKAVKELSDMRKKAAILPIDRLIALLIDETDFANIVSAMPSGSAAEENLQTLIGVANQYSSSGKGSISGFLKYFDALPEKGLLKGSAKSDNCVKIMSMHLSKGLQFPICIIANSTSDINVSDSKDRILYSNKFGIGFKYFQNETNDITDSIARMLISKENYVKTIEEKLRLIYVAMTRAEERLVLVASYSNAAKELSKAAQMLSQNQRTVNGEWLNLTKNMGEWITVAALLHPDAQMLRRIAEATFAPLKTDSRLNVIIMNEIKLEKKQSEEENEQILPDRELSALIKRNAEYTYKNEPLRDIRAKCSVSEIANKAENELFSFSEKPAFMQKGGLSAAARGTAIHRIMQFINMSENVDIESEIERLKEWQFITEKEAMAADRKKISAFFESDIYKEIISASEVKREMRFLTEIPACRLDESLPEKLKDTPVIVQGAVDLCFVTEKGVTVLDFKTDRVKDEQSLVEAYSEQLNIYAKACEKIFEKPVIKKVIYSFELSKEIEI